MAAPPFFTTAYRTLTSAVWICRGRDAPPQTKSTTWNPRRSVATSVHAHTLSPSFSCFSFQYSDSMTALPATSIGPRQSWQVLTFVAVRKVTKSRLVALARDRSVSCWTLAVLGTAGLRQELPTRLEACEREQIVQVDNQPSLSNRAASKTTRLCCTGRQLLQHSTDGIA